MTSWFGRTDRSWTSSGLSRVRRAPQWSPGSPLRLAAQMMLTELGCPVQSLEIDLDFMRNLKASPENSLREVEARYALQIQYLNGILLHLESELAQTWAEGQRQAEE
ncbi:Keratin, type I cytoskeletal 18 [Plecturocebus cupreus]